MPNHIYNIFPKSKTEKVILVKLLILVSVTDNFG